MLFEFEPGDFVINPNKKEWGIGQIQSIVKNKITVNFENSGKQVINASIINLEKLKMSELNLKKIAEDLIETFNEASLASIEIFKKGLNIKIKEDNSPVSNGDIKVNEIITEKIKLLTPSIPIISEETVNLNKKSI